MKKFVALTVSAGLLLANNGSCFGGGNRPAPTPVPVPCVTGDVPDEPPMIRDTLTGDSGRDIGLIAASALELRAWGRALLGIVEACRSPR
jgi:hypothetical protein